MTGAALKRGGGADLGRLEGADRVAHHAERAQLLGEAVAHRHRRVDDQRAPSRGRRRRRRLRLGGDPAQSHGHGERRAGAERAVDLDVAAHQLAQPLDDHQAEPGAAVAARHRAVGLGERAEQPRHHRRRDADPGVGDGQAQAPAVAVVAEVSQRDDDVAALGELDRVADQVGQDLPQAAGVAVAAGVEPGRDVAHQLEPATVGRQPEQLDGVLDHGPDIELELLELQPSGLDLGEVEDVVDHGEQALRRGPHRGREVALPRQQIGREQQLGQAEHAVHRRPDLVAHVGQELGLGAAGGVGGVAGRDQLVVGAGDPLERGRQRAGALADLGLERGRGLEQREAAAALQIHRPLDPGHQLVVDPAQPRDLALELLDRRHRRYARPIATPVKVWLTCIALYCSP